MIDAKNRERQGSGQVVTSGPVRTERWLEESLESWARRHKAAVEEFQQSGERRDG